MRSLFLIQDLRGAASRYRVLQYLPALAAAGIEAHVECIPKDAARRRSLMGELARFDLVFIQKKLFNPLQVRAIRRSARALVFDLDDAIMFKSSGARSLTRRWKFNSIAEVADLVIAGNEYLADQARTVTSAVEVIPTALDPSRYDSAIAERKEMPGQPLRLGWIGSRSTLAYLNELTPILRRLAARRADVRLKIICDAFPDFPFIALEKQLWNEADEPVQVASFDIGLAPLPENPWTRGKCGLKILQYYAARKPVVGSPVGVQREMVKHGITGFLAESEDEWIDALVKLLDSSELRTAMGLAGRALLEERYSLQVNAPRFVDAILRAASMRIYHKSAGRKC